MTMNWRQAICRHSRPTSCSEVSVVNTVAIETAVDTGRINASIGMAINPAPNPAALRTVNALKSTAA